MEGDKLKVTNTSCTAWDEVCCSTVFNLSQLVWLAGSSMYVETGSPALLAGFLPAYYHL